MFFRMIVALAFVGLSACGGVSQRTQMSASLPVCGDGKVEGAEVCDNGEQTYRCPDDWEMCLRCADDCLSYQPTYQPTQLRLKDPDQVYPENMQDSSACTTEHRIDGKLVGRVSRTFDERGGIEYSSFDVNGDGEADFETRDTYSKSDVRRIKSMRRAKNVTKHYEYDGDETISQVTIWDGRLRYTQQYVEDAGDGYVGYITYESTDKPGEYLKREHYFKRDNAKRVIGEKKLTNGKLEYEEKSKFDSAGNQIGFWKDSNGDGIFERVEGSEYGTHELLHWFDLDGDGNPDTLMHQTLDDQGREIETREEWRTIDDQCRKKRPCKKIKIEANITQTEYGDFGTRTLSYTLRNEKKSACAFRELDKQTRETHIWEDENCDGERDSEVRNEYDTDYQDENKPKYFEQKPSGNFDKDRHFRYFDNGLWKEIVVRNGVQIAQITLLFNKAGRLRRQEIDSVNGDSRNQDKSKVIVEYDHAGRTTRIWVMNEDHPNGIDEIRRFDQMGHLVQLSHIEDDKTVDLFVAQYDDEGRLLSRSERTRTKHGLVTESWAKRYDTEGRLIFDRQHTKSKKVSTEYRYERGDLVQTKVDHLDDGIIDAVYHYRYDHKHQLLSERVDEDADGKVDLERRYEFDKTGRKILACIDSDMDGECNRSAHFTYDHAGKPAPRAAEANGNNKADTVEFWEYDVFGLMTRYTLQDANGKIIRETTRDRSCLHKLNLPKAVAKKESHEE